MAKQVKVTTRDGDQMLNASTALVDAGSLFIESDEGKTVAAFAPDYWRAVVVDAVVVSS